MHAPPHSPEPPPRLLPERTLPPYSYVPGHFAHPVTDARGHMYGEQPEEVPPPEPDGWRDCEAYLFGLDLFNYGYYWEAHEAWEAVWHAVGRRGRVADFFKGLIKLAAAGVKAREGKPQGLRRHAERAEELFLAVERARGNAARYFFGFQPAALADAARNLADCAAERPGQADLEYRLPLVLSPAEERRAE